MFTIVSLLAAFVHGERVVMRSDNNQFVADSSTCVDCPDYVALTASEKMDRLWSKIIADEYEVPYETQCTEPKKWRHPLCHCDGMVRYGVGDSWSTPKAVSGSIDCNWRNFDNPPPEGFADEHFCVCTHEFPKNWIGLLERNLHDTKGRVDNGTMTMFFDRFSDENPRNSAKTIHTYGSTAKVRFVAQSDTGYTGMFKTGAEHALLRLSIVADWEQACKGGTDFNFDGCLKPSMAFKMLRDNDYSSNTVAQVNLGDGVGWNFNFFKFKHSTLLPAPHGFGATVVKNLFKHAARADETNGVGLQELASDGSKAKQERIYIKDPQVLFFVPSDNIQEVFSNLEHDPRKDFKQIGKNTRLFDVYTVNFFHRNCTEDAQPVTWDDLGRNCTKTFLGHVETTSRFVASAYEDHRLFFQHERITKGGEWQRKKCVQSDNKDLSDLAELRMAGDFRYTCYQTCGPGTEDVDPSASDASCPFSDLDDGW